MSEENNDLTNDQNIEEPVAPDVVDKNESDIENTDNGDELSAQDQLQAAQEEITKLKVVFH